MKHIYFVLLFALFTVQAFAQKDFRPGYIVQQGDTVKGLVDYRGNTRSAKLTTFKLTPEAAEQEYTPVDIAGYGFPEENKYFESKTIPASDTQPVQKLFVNVLIKGKASIYTHRDSFHQDHYYLSKDDGELTELTQKEYTRIDPVTKKNHRVVEQTYLGTLAAAFYDCKEPNEAQIKGVKLMASSLIAIAKRYNQCVAPEQTVLKENKSRTRITVGPVLGYTYSNLTFGGSSYLSEITFNNELPLSAGLAFNVAVPNLSEKLTIQIDALLVAAKFEGSVEQGPHYGRSNNYQTNFDMLYVKLPVQLRYTYPHGLLRPFVNGGPMLGYILKDTNETHKESYMGGSSYTETTPAIPPGYLRPLLQGLTAGTGIHIPLQGKSVTLEARYEINSGLTYSQSMVSSINAFYLLLTYGF
ncbi:hypothetical protein OB13_07840 [Pontibacter sp. HJ8]